MAAISMLALSAVATSVEQSATEAEDRQSADKPAHRAASTTDSATNFLGAYAGVPYTYPSDVSVKKSGSHDFIVEDVGWDGRPFKSPIYYGVRIARWNEGVPFGGMLDFTHSKALSRFDDTNTLSGTLDGAPAPARSRMGDIFKHLEFSHGHNMLTLNGLYRLPRLAGRLLPYVGVGAGVSLPHTEVGFRKDERRTYEYQYAGPVGQALIGVELRLPRLSYFLEYKFSYAAYQVPLTQQDGHLGITDLWRQFRRWLSGEAPPGGWLATQLASHQLIGGLGVRFAQPSAAAP